MKYEILHLENDLDKQTGSLLASVEASILAIDNFDDILYDVQSECNFHSEIGGNNYILSAFDDGNQIRIAYNTTGDDFLVLRLTEEA